MKKNIYLLGAGGHSRVIIRMLEAIGKYKINGIYENEYRDGEMILKYPILGKPDDIPGNVNILVCVGNILEKKKLINKYESQLLIDNIIHPSAFIDETVNMDMGNQIMPAAMLNVLAIIGKWNIINSGAVIEHEVEIGNYCHISVNSTVCGRVKIGNNCFVGAGSVVNDKISICDDVIIGSGAVVAKDVTEPGTYVGIPARKIK